MKTNRRTNNMAKRAMALVLSLSMVFGMTWTVFAEEITESTEVNVTEEAAVMTEAASESGSSDQNVSEVAAVQEAENTAAESTETILDANEAVTVVAELDVTDPVVYEALIASLNEGAAAVGETKNDLSDAAEAMDAAQTLAAEAEALTDVAKDSAEQLDKEQEAFDLAADKTEENADAAIADADTANTSRSKAEAVQARDDAVAELGVAEEGLKEAEDAFNAATEEAKQAEADYNAAKNEHDQALSKVEDAKKALSEAKENSTAAMEALKAAQAQAGLLGDKVQKLAGDQEKLEEIRDQYYAMMVYFYWAAKSKNQDLVFDENGTMDLDATAEILKKNTAKINKVSENGGSKYWALGRYVTSLVVEQMILSRDDVDPQTANFQFGTTGREEKALIGTVFKNWDGNDQTALEGDKHENVYRQPVETAGGVNFKWNYPGNSDKGRTNYVTVTFTDKDGVEHTENYNFISKSSNFGDKLDIENGVFYLARVDRDEDGKYTLERVEDENNYDDYKKLVEAIDAIKDLEKYQAAKDAVDAAAEKVAELEKEVKALENISIDSSRLDALKEQLDQANEELAAAEDKKAALEVKVEEARKAVEGIDLSRFKVRPAAEEDDDTAPVSPAAPTITSITPAVVVTPVLTDILPVELTPSVTAAEAEGTGLVDLIDAELPGAQEAGTEEEITTLEDEILPAAAVAETVALDDEELPAAAEVEEGAQIWWWWILLLIAAIVAYSIYRYNKNRINQENA